MEEKKETAGGVWKCAYVCAQVSAKDDGVKGTVSGLV